MFRCTRSDAGWRGDRAMLTFSERIRHRQRVWWGRPGPWSSPATYWRAMHRLRDRYALRDRTWPMARWRCCEVWQRSLLNKWNSREFATMHGVATPALYWAGRRIGALPLERLPEHFVLRPAWGAGGVGTYLMAGDFDHGTQRPLTRAAMVAEIRRRGPIAPFPYLAEEFMTTPEGRCERVLEYKVYMFGGQVGAIQCIRSHRYDDADWSYHCSFFPDWSPMPHPIYHDSPQRDPIEAPESLGTLLDAARRLGTALGTFVRVDFYLTPRGPCFGEFSSTPRAGRHLSPFADRYFGKLWQDHIPDAT